MSLLRYFILIIIVCLKLNRSNQQKQFQKSIDIPFNRPIIPVLHNLDATHVSDLHDFVKRYPVFSVSLRHSAALNAACEIKRQFGDGCAIGISTVVSEQQVRLLYILSIQFFPVQ